MSDAFARALPDALPTVGVYIGALLVLISGWMVGRGLRGLLRRRRATRRLTAAEWERLNRKPRR